MTNLRDYKTFAPGGFYHVFNRGNGKQDIFLDVSDYRIFLRRLEENLFPSRSLEDGLRGKGVKTHTPYKRKPLADDAFDLVCYCLMPNHYHLLIKQNEDIPITKLIAKVCTSYSKYFNKKYGRVGHLFQDKFKAVVVNDNEYLRWLSAYIHQNPKTAKLTSAPESYKWSSYQEYVHSKPPEDGHRGICKTAIVLGQFKNLAQYRAFTEESGAIIAEKKSLRGELFLD